MFRMTVPSSRTPGIRVKPMQDTFNVDRCHSLPCREAVHDEEIPRVKQQPRSSGFDYKLAIIFIFINFYIWFFKLDHLVTPLKRKAVWVMMIMSLGDVLEDDTIVWALSHINECCYFKTSSKRTNS